MTIVRRVMPNQINGKSLMQAGLFPQILEMGNFLGNGAGHDLAQGFMQVPANFGRKTRHRFIHRFGDALAQPLVEDEIDPAL